MSWRDMTFKRGKKTLCADNVTVGDLESSKDQIAAEVVTFTNLGSHL